jgi:hypothetical protein
MNPRGEGRETRLSTLASGLPHNPVEGGKKLNCCLMSRLRLCATDWKTHILLAEGLMMMTTSFSASHPYKIISIFRHFSAMPGGKKVQNLKRRKGK